MLTRRGRFTLALGGGTYLGAWAFGAHTLYAPAVGLLLAVGVAMIWTSALARPFRLRRHVDQNRPLEGDDVVVRVELETDGGVVPASVVLQDPAGRLGERDVVVNRDGRFLRAVYRLTRVPRGRYRFTGARAVVEDPFGLARRVQPLEDSAPLLVYPRLARLTTPLRRAGPARPRRGADPAPPARGLRAPQCPGVPERRVASTRALAVDRPASAADGQGAGGRPAGRDRRRPRCPGRARRGGAGRFQLRRPGARGGIAAVGARPPRPPCASRHHERRGRRRRLGAVVRAGLATRARASRRRRAGRPPPGGVAARRPRGRGCACSGPRRRHGRACARRSSTR